MNELEVHLRKDIRLVRTESTFLVFVTAIIVASVFMSYYAVLSYLQMGHSYPLINHGMMESNLRQTMLSFWTMAVNVIGLLLIVISASGFGSEKESGILRYTIAYGADARMMFLSKFLFLAFLAMVALIASMAMFVVMISASGSLPLDVGAFISSALVVYLQFLILISLGMVLSISMRKKSTAIVIAFVIMLGTAGISAYMEMDGYNAAQQQFYLERYDGTVNFNNSFATEHFPLMNEVVMYMLPWKASSEAMSHSLGMAEREQLGNYDQVTFMSLEADVAVAALMCIGYLWAGYWLLSRDVTGRPGGTFLKGWHKK